MLLLLPALLISMTGCNRRYVVISPGETIQVNKSQLDRIYQDNENLLKALQQCRGNK